MSSPASNSPSASDFSDASSPPSDLKSLLARALLLLEQEGEAAVQHLLELHPEHADGVRLRLRQLSLLGLLARPDGTSLALPASVAPEQTAGGSPEARGAADTAASAAATLGPYRLLRELGAGGMGVVFLACDDRLNRLVALKTLAGALALSARARERFLREVRAVARLEHPNIVRIFDCGEQQGLPWFAMEYVDGRTLAALLDELRGAPADAARRGRTHVQQRYEALVETRRRALADSGAGVAAAEASAAPRDRDWIEAAARIVALVANALAHAHAAGIVHRDVKPSNILLDGAWSPRLFDFGLARNDSDAALTHTGTFLGTPHYVAPEQCASSADDAPPAPAADIYSLGATLYESLALRPPFDGASTAEILQAIQTREPTPLRSLDPSLPRDLVTICETALQKDPRRRYASARAFEEDLRRFLERRPILARPVGGPERALRFAQRNPAHAAALVLGALVVLGVPFGLWMHSRGLAATITQLNQANQDKDVALSDKQAALEEKGKAFDEQQRLLKEAEATAAVGEQMIELADAEELGRNGRVLDLLLLLRQPLHALGELAPLRAAGLQRALGAVLLVHGSNDVAKQQLDSAEQLFRQHAGADSIELALTLNFIGNWHRQEGADETALASYREAFEIWKRNGLDLSGEGRTLRMNLARLLVDRREFREADEIAAPIVQQYDESRSEDVRAFGGWLMHQARVSQAQRDFPQAYAAADAALRLARRHPEMRLLYVYEALELCAQCDRSLTRFQDASAKYLAAAAVVRSIQEVPTQREARLALSALICMLWGSVEGPLPSATVEETVQFARALCTHDWMTSAERAENLSLCADAERALDPTRADPELQRACLASVELDPAIDETRIYKLRIASRLGHALLTRGERAAAELAYSEAESYAAPSDGSIGYDILQAEGVRIRLLLEAAADPGAACRVADEWDCWFRQKYAPWRLALLEHAPRARLLAGDATRALAEVECAIAEAGGMLPAAWGIRMRFVRALARWRLGLDPELRLETVLPYPDSAPRAENDLQVLREVLRSTEAVARRIGASDLVVALEAAADSELESLRPR
jgi:serine/threonine protein kinase